MIPLQRFPHIAGGNLSKGLTEFFSKNKFSQIFFFLKSCDFIFFRPPFTTTLKYTTEVAYFDVEVKYLSQHMIFRKDIQLLFLEYNLKIELVTINKLTKKRMYNK
jgi:hypothetical protein